MIVEMCTLFLYSLGNRNYEGSDKMGRMISTMLVDYYCKGYFMYGVKINTTIPEFIPTYSPVTLCNTWPKIARLLLMFSLSAWGSILNGFFVASFFVEHSIRKAGLVFMACIGFADLLITSGVMGTSWIVLLASEWDNIYSCVFVQLLGVSATYCYSLFFMLVALENHLRLCRPKAAYEIFSKTNVSIITVSIFIISFLLGSLGVFLGLDYDYCTRLHIGNSIYRLMSAILFHAIPSVITVFCLVSSYLHVRRRAIKKKSYKRSVAYGHDNSLATLNLVAYALYVIAWFPYIFASVDLPTTTNARYYHSIWVGLGRSLVTNFLYAVLNTNFRHAFGNLLNYVFCKNSLSGRPSTYRRRKYSRVRTTRVRLVSPNTWRDRNVYTPPQADCESQFL